MTRLAGGPFAIAAKSPGGMLNVADFAEYSRKVAPDLHSAANADLPVIYFDDIKPSLDAADFVEGLLIRSAMAVVYGQSNSGKTFWVCDMALHVAAGKSWNGREVECGAVLWLAMEGSMGIQNRVEAWRQYHEIDGTIPFAIVPVALNLLDPYADTDPLIATINRVAKHLEMPVILTVVDTLSRAIAGGNENAPDDMGAIVTNGTRIQQETKSALTWIHHCGKDEAKGARGHSLLRAATDTEIEITAEAAQRTARVTKQRELDCSGEFAFTLKVVELGQNKRGKPVTSCVVEGQPDGHTAGAVLSGLRGHSRRALGVLRDSLAESGKGGFAGVPTGFLSVPEEWWRRRFYERTGSDGKDDLKQDSKRAAFNRARDELMSRRLVGLNKERVWIVHDQRFGQTPDQTESQTE